MDMSTSKTSFGRWIEAVNQADNFPFDVGNMLENTHELGAGQVAYLAPPKGLHPLHGQVFKEQMIEGIGQGVGALEEPVTALVDDRLIDARDDPLGLLPAARELNFARKMLVGALQCSHRLTIVQRAFNSFAYRGDQESLQTKVKPDAVTRSELSVLVDCFLSHKGEPEIAKTITLDGDSLNVCWNVAAFAEFIDLALYLHLVIIKQFPTGLLESKATILLTLLQAWRRRANLVLEITEEQLIGFVDTINNVLDSLATNQVPRLITLTLFQLGDMFHQDKLVQALPGQSIIASMQGNTVIIDQSCNVNLLVQYLILFRPIKLALVRLDDFHTLFWFAIYCMLTARGAPPTVQTT